VSGSELSGQGTLAHRNIPRTALAAADDRYRHSRNQCIKYAKRELYIYSDKNGDWVECVFRNVASVRR
jgi:hypothetical protein